MKALIFSILFIFTTQVIAATFHKVGDDIRMRAPNCDAFLLELEALKKWTQSTGKMTCDLSSVDFKLYIPSDINPYCEGVVTDCVPDHVVKYQGVKSSLHGPNCFNLALVMKGLLPHLRHTPAEEMTHFMQAPYCHFVGKEEKLQPGDIGAFRKDGEEVHGFIYISDNTVYSKNGEFKSQPYELQHMRNLTNSSVYNKDTNIEYFRCKSMEEVLKENEASISEVVKNSIELFNVIECRISPLFFGQTIEADESYKLIVDSAKILATYLKQEIKNIDRLEPIEKKLLAGLLIRVQTLQRMIYSNRFNQKQGEGEDGKTIRSLDTLNKLVFSSLEQLSEKLHSE